MREWISSEGLSAGLLVLIIGGATASWYAGRLRLRDWAHAEGVKIVKMEYGWRLDQPKGTFRYVGRGGRALRVVVEDSSQHAHTAYINVGGVFALLFDRDPVFVWEGGSPSRLTRPS